MKYSKMLRNLFPGLVLNAEDLLFLESFQIEYFPARVPRDEFSILLNAYPLIKRYLASMCPSIDPFITEVLAVDGKRRSETVEQICDDFLWEIADLIVYSKYPEIYDANVKFNWSIDEIIPVKNLEGKIIIDAGAGPGKLSFMAARYAEAVFAVEPAKGFRKFIREKADKENIKNIYPIDGSLGKIPFMNDFADILITSNAIGWNLEAELHEIERILKPGGEIFDLKRF